LVGDLKEKFKMERASMVVDWITIDLKARWRIVGYALKSQIWKSGSVLPPALGAKGAVLGAVAKEFLGEVTASFTRCRKGCARRSAWPIRFVRADFVEKIVLQDIYLGFGLFLNRIYSKTIGVLVLF
jgi:hypothetical protein